VVQLPNPDEVRATLDPVWFNTYWIKNALELYEGVSKHADELKENYNHFFGVIQKFSLDAAVLHISKIFDKSNPRYQKDTIPSLFSYLKANLTDAYVVRLKVETLIGLGISQCDADRLLPGLRTDFRKYKDEFIDIIENIVPDNKNNDTLKFLLSYRNKILTHQERLDDALKEQLKYLPSLHEMEQLNNWAINFCLLAISLLTPNISLIPNGQSVRIAALNVVAKLLDKELDNDYAARKLFYARI